MRKPSVDSQISLLGKKNIANYGGPYILRTPADTTCCKYVRYGNRHSRASATCFQACSRPAPSGQDNAAAGAPARGMCSNDVHLTVLRRCGTDVAGLWVSGGALLRSVEEQHRLYVESAVRRASPCTTSCCPLLSEPSPCSSTHPCTPARTIALSGCVHSRAHI